MLPNREINWWTRQLAEVLWIDLWLFLVVMNKRFLVIPSHVLTNGKRRKEQLGLTALLIYRFHVFQGQRRKSQSLERYSKTTAGWRRRRKDRKKNSQLVYTPEAFCWEVIRKEMPSQHPPSFLILLVAVGLAACGTITYEGGMTCKLDRPFLYNLSYVAYGDG